MNNRFKALIFDIGNVVFEISFQSAFEAFAKHSSLPIEELNAKLIFDSIFEDFERGMVSPETFRAHVSKKVQMNITTEEFDRCWNNIYLPVFPGLEELLINLKKNYRIIALSNTNIIHTTDWMVRYENTLQHFEKILCSNEIGMRKPDDEIYHYALEYLNMQAHEVIFMDDNRDNINASRRLGIQSILVNDFKQMKAELLDLGIKI
ncbi:MAG: HAD family phosphatase [Bacteroidota bacterium]